MPYIPILKCHMWFLRFFFIFIFLFNWRLITILWCFLPHTDMNQPQVYMCPLSWSPLPPPSPSHPSSLSQCTGLECPFHASNLDCSSISNMVIYMFQCYSLKSSHAPHFPQSPKLGSLYLCLFCYLVYRVVVTILLNSKYMC